MKHLRQYIRRLIIEHNKKKEQEERKRRNQNRRDFEKAGLVKAGDGKEIDHKVSIKNGGSDKKSNLKVVSKKENRKKAGK